MDVWCGDLGLVEQAIEDALWGLTSNLPRLLGCCEARRAIDIPYIYADDLSHLEDLLPFIHIDTLSLNWRP